MEFEIQRTEFLEGLRLTQGVVERRNTLPILSNTLIEPIEGGVSILATDLDIGVRRSCTANVKSSGSITVNARKLFELVKEMKGTTIRVRSLDNHRVEVLSGKTRLNLVGLDPKEFPSIPGLTGKPARRDDREHAVRGLSRRNANQPEWRLPREPRGSAADGGHRWAPPGDDRSQAQRQGSGQGGDSSPA